MKQVRAQALQALDSNKGRDPRLNFIALALRGRKVSFEKVVGMIDEMIVLLAKEQTTDDEKKEYCEAELDIAEDNIKELEHTIANLEKDIADGEAAVATLTEEIAALIQGIKDLDKAVAEATETRKEENEEYTETMAADTAAEQLLQLAKNRLNKFYNPKLYKPPAKRELSGEERITVSLGGTAPPTPRRHRGHGRRCARAAGGAAAPARDLRSLREEGRGEQRRHRNDRSPHQRPRHGDDYDHGRGEERTGRLRQIHGRLCGQARR